MQVRAGLPWSLKVALVDDRRGAGLIADCDIPSGQFVIEAIGEVQVIVTVTVTWYT